MKVTLPPIRVAVPTASWKRIQAMMDARIGSPMGVAPTTVGDTYRRAKYMDPCPRRVGIIPKRRRPPNSPYENLVRSDPVKKAMKRSVTDAVKNSVRE